MRGAVPFPLYTTCVLGMFWWLTHTVKVGLTWFVRRKAAESPPPHATLTQCLEYPEWVSAIIQVTRTSRHDAAKRIADRHAVVRAQAYVDKCRSFHERLRVKTEWFADGLGSHVLFCEFDVPNRGRVEALLYITGRLDMIRTADLSSLPLATTDLSITGGKGIYAWTAESAVVVAAAASFRGGSEHSMLIEALMSDVAYADLHRDSAMAPCQRAILRPGKGQLRARMQQHRSEIRRHADGRRSPGASKYREYYMLAASQGFGAGADEIRTRILFDFAPVCQEAWAQLLLYPPHIDALCVRKACQGGYLGAGASELDYKADLFLYAVELAVVCVCDARVLLCPCTSGYEGPIGYHARQRWREQVEHRAD